MISHNTQKFLQKFQDYFTTKPSGKESKIHVDYIASRVASFYEKIRSIVDYQEEHLLRKNAIERMLKRRLIIKKDGKNIAKPLIYELIRAGHFPNDIIPERKIEEVNTIIDKYILILNNLPALKKNEKEELSNWITGLASCEIEEKLAPPTEDEILAEYMYEIMEERILLKDNVKFSKKEKGIQLFIAIQKALLRADEPLITYRLLKLYYPEWTNASKDLILEIARDFHSLKKALKKQFEHPLGPKLFNLLNRYNTPYLILRDVILKYPKQIREKISQPESLEPLIEKAYQNRYQRSKAKLGRAAIYSTISIFITKMLLAFAIEIPLDIYIIPQFSYINLAISILFPPLLMFFIISTIRPPPAENAQKVMWEAMKIVYESKKKEAYEVKLGKKRGLLLSGIIGLTYLITFIISFGVLFWILLQLNFSIVSQIIFVAFICLIGFAGAKIRQRAKELSVEKEKESGLIFLMDFFFLPFVRMGKWLSARLTKVNLVILLLTFVWETPFQVFVEFLENWSSFLKEKKEEIH
jgi:hypothetical protein